MLRCDEAWTAPGSLQRADCRGDVVAQPVDGIGQFLRLFPEHRTVLVDDILNHGKEEIVLGGKVPVERLQGDSCLFDELLRGEVRTLALHETASRRHDGLRLFDTPVSRPLHDG